MDICAQEKTFQVVMPDKFFLKSSTHKNHIHRIFPLGKTFNKMILNDRRIEMMEALDMSGGASSIHFFFRRTFSANTLSSTHFNTITHYIN